MKNLKSNIVNILAILFSALTYVFLSQAYFTFSYSISIGGLNGEAGSITGYEVLKNYLEGDSKDQMLAVSLIFLTIFAALVILCSIINILANCGVIKNKGVVKITNFVNVVSSILMVVFVAIGLFIMIDLTKDASLSIGSSSIDYKIGWASIVNFIISIAIFILTIFAFKTSKQTKKKKK